MPGKDRTLEPSIGDDGAGASDDSPAPGLVLVFSGGGPTLQTIPLAGGDVAVLGRGDDCDVVVADGKLSRRHAELRATHAGVTVRDLGSQNGTFVDGARLADDPVSGRVLRAGGALWLLVGDVRPLVGAVERIGAAVVGPTLRRAWTEIRAIAADSKIIHVRGETGAGKELAARLYHEATGTGGPFVAVNCATIPAPLAESLLFGARRGAFTGATANSRGLADQAAGGTLFLDEIGELALDVQAKLLRMVEVHEIWPLGATQPHKVELRLCTATHRDLQRDVAAGRFRDDLFFRLARPHVDLPPLRDRLEEIPWLVQAVLGQSAPKLGIHGSFVEAVLLRSWPGNVRELLTEVADAGRRAVAAGATRLAAAHLSATAGQPLPAGAELLTGPRSARQHRPEEIEAAIRAADGNLAAAARALGLHRTQVRRWVAKKEPEPE